MCKTFICQIPKEWPYNNVSVTKKLDVKEYEQLKLKRKDGQHLGEDYYLIYDSLYVKLYVVSNDTVQCSWECHPISFYKQLIKTEEDDDKRNVQVMDETKYSDTIEQTFCLEEYEWWDDSRVIYGVAKWPEKTYGQYIYNEQFISEIASKKITLPKASPKTLPI